MAEAGASLGALRWVLDAATQSQVERALEECAAQAHRTVNEQYFNGESPDWHQCHEQVQSPDTGQVEPRYLWLGRLKHTRALTCAEQALERLIPGRFSLQQRYLHNKATGQTRPVSVQEEVLMRQSGLGSELKGSIMPDVVIHDGSPSKPQAVYDFKFPCPESNLKQWRGQRSNKESSQGDTYEKLLGIKPRLIDPKDFIP